MLGIILWLLITLRSTLAASNYKEHLDVIPIYGEDVLTVFTFKNTFEGDLQANPIDFGIFPPEIGRLVRNHQVKSLALSLVIGRWLYAKWGVPPEDIHTSSPMGLLIDAQLKDKNHWKSLLSELSGLLSLTCHLGDPHFVTEQPVRNENLLQLRMPKENFCTENLTRFYRLLPCGSQAGLASILNPMAIFDSSYRALNFSIESHAVDGVDRLTATLSLSIVFSLVDKSGVSLSDLFKWPFAEHYCLVPPMIQVHGPDAIVVYNQCT